MKYFLWLNWNGRREPLGCWGDLEQLKADAEAIFIPRGGAYRWSNFVIEVRQ